MDDIEIGKFKIRVTSYQPFRASTHWEDPDDDEEIEFVILAITEQKEEIDITDIFEEVGLFSEMYDIVIEKIHKQMQEDDDCTYHGEEE